MTSQAKPIKNRINRAQTLPLTVRLLLILLVVAVQLIYIPTSNRLSGGIEPKLSIDIFPTWPIWVLPYVLCYPLWISGILWATFKMEDHLFRSFVTAGLITCSLAALLFIFFPTYVDALTFSEQDFFTSLLRYIHESGGRYDAFPSGHIYITVWLALFYNRWYPRYKFCWVLIPVTVAFSTLFTHQHFIVDLIGGLVVALIGYHGGLQWTGFSPLQAGAAKRRLLEPPS